MGAYIQRGDLTEVFFALQVWGAYIWRGLFLEFIRIWSSNSTQFLSSLPFLSFFVDLHYLSL